VNAPSSAGQHGAGQGQLHRRGAVAAGRAQDVDDHGGQRGAEEGEPHVAAYRRDAELRDADHDHERGPGLDAEDARFGQGVARHALHERAGQRERGAQADPDQGARHAQVADDDVRPRAVEVRKRRDHRAPAHLGAPVREAGHDAEAEQAEGDHKPRGA